ncbi:MAG TPA: response regulator, partial [Bordetella sp.]|nr:response regulator [Bordetella sp.]
MPHLLVLDDDAAIREVLAEIAREHGFSVAQAATMKDAVIQLQRQQPDLVLTDVRLPGDSGMEIFSRMPNSEAEVVVITGHGSMDNAVEALRLGATDYLVKPVCMDRLVEILNRVAADRGSARDDTPFQEPGRFGKLLGQSESME